MITVTNKRKGGKGEYIGRPSPLGNPYTNKSHGQGIRVSSLDEAISKYEEWIDQKIEDNDYKVMTELNRLKLLSLKGDLNLVCWCAPNKCHGDIIKKKIECLPAF